MKALIRLIVNFFVLVVDGIYRDRPYARFNALKTIARVPYSWRCQWCLYHAI